MFWALHMYEPIWSQELCVVGTITSFLLRVRSLGRREVEKWVQSSGRARMKAAGPTLFSTIACHAASGNLLILKSTEGHGHVIFNSGEDSSQSLGKKSCKVLWFWLERAKSAINFLIKCSNSFASEVWVKIKWVWLLTANCVVSNKKDKEYRDSRKNSRNKMLSIQQAEGLHRTIQVDDCSKSYAFKGIKTEIFS